MARFRFYNIVGRRDQGVREDQDQGDKKCYRSTCSPRARKMAWFPSHNIVGHQDRGGQGDRRWDKKCCRNRCSPSARRSPRLRYRSIFVRRDMFSGRTGFLVHLCSHPPHRSRSRYQHLRLLALRLPTPRIHHRKARCQAVSASGAAASVQLEFVRRHRENWPCLELHPSFQSQSATCRNYRAHSGRKFPITGFHLIRATWEASRLKSP
jgi:hypothetical protein